MLEQTTIEFSKDSLLQPLDHSLRPDSMGLDLNQSPSFVSALHARPIDESLIAQWGRVESHASILGSDLFSENTVVQSLMESSAAYSSSSSVDPLIGTSVTDSFSSDEVLAPQTSRGSRYLAGTLRGDRFSVNLREALTVISGNGNVDYGQGAYDYLDLSNISSKSVSNWSLAESGGVLFNLGRGDRVFDSLQFTNGSQVLFEGLDRVQFADGILDLSVDPNDPGFGQQWNLHMMGVQNAWRFTQGSSKILIGVQDTGLGYNAASQSFHADISKTRYLSNNVADDFFREVRDRSYGARASSHGTSVQSIISATSNNGYGMSGINWNSNVFNIDVLDANSGDLTKAQAAQAMINDANRQGQKLVVNMSLGGGPLTADFASLVARNQQNALFVIASGNDGKNSLDNPASLGQQYGNVIAVGASWGKQDRRGRATNPGDRIQYRDDPRSDWGSNYGSGLSLMGPSEVLAATASPSRSGAQFGWASNFNGTSAATPNVAGVASLVWSINPAFSAQQVHQIMAETAYDLGTSGYDLVTGFGFVNADAAIRRAMAISRIARSTSPFGASATAQTAFENTSPAETAFFWVRGPAIGRAICGSVYLYAAVFQERCCFTFRRRYAKCLSPFRRFAQY